MEPRGVEPRSRGCKPRVLAVDTKAPGERPPGLEPGLQRWQRRVLPADTTVARARTEGIEPSPQRGWSPLGRHVLVRTKLRRLGSNQHHPGNNRVSCRLNDTASCSPRRGTRTPTLLFVREALSAIELPAVVKRRQQDSNLRAGAPACALATRRLADSAMPPCARPGVVWRGRAAHASVRRAEGEGVEPPRPEGPPVFETGYRARGSPSV